MSARFLVTWPCQDACGTVTTDEVVEGAPVYACPGCDSRWIEEREIGSSPQPESALDEGDREATL